MKKGIIGLGITSFIFLAVASTLFLLIPVLVSGFDMSIIYSGIKQQIEVELNFGVESTTRLLFLIISAAGSLLVLFQIVILIIGKKPLSILFTIFFLLCFAGSLFLFVWHSDINLTFALTNDALISAGHENWLLLLQVVFIAAIVFALITYVLDIVYCISSIKMHRKQKHIVPVEQEIELIKEELPNDYTENKNDEIVRQEENIEKPIVESQNVVANNAPIEQTIVTAEAVKSVEEIKPVVEQSKEDLKVEQGSTLSNQPTENIIIPQPIIAPVFADNIFTANTPILPETKTNSVENTLTNDIMNIMNREVGVSPEPVFHKEEIEAIKADIPTLVQVGPSIEEIRSVIKEENNNIKPASINIDAEIIRLIVREELQKMNLEQKTKTVEQTQPIAQVQENIINKPQVGIVTTFGPRAKEEKVLSANPNKIIRIPFQTRMIDAEKDMKTNYNILKNEILSYGVKSRVSNSGDTFRLHTKTYVKLTIAGKSLKLYFALNPKDYENSKMPILDAGAKNIYKEIPLVFKVKSELSLRRARQLIADVMEKDALEQGKVDETDWIKPLKDMKISDDDKE